MLIITAYCLGALVIAVTGAYFFVLFKMTVAHKVPIILKDIGK